MPKKKKRAIDHTYVGVILNFNFREKREVCTKKDTEHNDVQQGCKEKGQGKA
jgi:hypothetical protein